MIVITFNLWGRCFSLCITTSYIVIIVNKWRQAVLKFYPNSKAFRFSRLLQSGLKSRYKRIFICCTLYIISVLFLYMEKVNMHPLLYGNVFRWCRMDSILEYSCRVEIDCITICIADAVFVNYIKVTSFSVTKTSLINCNTD